MEGPELSSFTIPCRETEEAQQGRNTFCSLWTRTAHTHRVFWDDTFVNLKELLSVRSTQVELKKNEFNNIEMNSFSWIEI